jgi:hypothetical protein
LTCVNNYALEYANFEAKINDMRERAQGAGATPGSLKTSAKKELFVRCRMHFFCNLSEE